jgi:GNAT superfamily N-acetyltransferase
MKTIHTVLREDFGLQDRDVVRKRLLTEPGVHGVSFEESRNGLLIEYDPALIDDHRLTIMMCRHGVLSWTPPAKVEANQWIEVLADGRRVLVRAICPDDIARNIAFLQGLSPPSKHFLFLGGVNRLSDAELRRLCDPDYENDMAFVALAAEPGSSQKGRQVGICRYAGTSSTEGAEISVAVADDWQHQGLGQKLLRRLIHHARAHGVKRLYSIDSAANDGMRKLGAQLGFTEGRDPNDRRQVILSLKLQ